MIALLVTLCCGFQGDGAKPVHWAYRPPVAATLPAVANEAWCRNPIDRFVLAALEQEGLDPSPEADRSTLVRRLSLDLIGLPPTPREVDDAIADAAPDWYERVVDRLLASPRYGERMARPWLDLARYADTNGYEKDLPRSLWPWREWVIRALNADVPYDRFSIAQLAGDLLPNATIDQFVATGFHRNTLLNDEGGADPEEFRVAAIVDRVNTTATIWLGSTFGCAQCHDHKYDPFTQQEYFGLYAFFDQSEDSGVGNAPEIEILTPEQNLVRDAGRARIAKLEQELRDSEPNDGERAISLAARSLLSIPIRSDTIFHESFHDGGEAGAIGGAARFDGTRSLDRGDAVTLEGDRAFSYGAFFHADGSGALLGRIDPAHGYRGFDLYSDDGRLQVHLIHDWPSNGIKIETVERVAPPTAGRLRHAFVTYDGSGKAAGLVLYVDGEPVATRVAADSLAGSIVAAVPLRVGGREGVGTFRGILDDVRIYGAKLEPAEVARIALESRRDVIEEDVRSNAARRAEIADIQAKIAALKFPTSMIMRERKEPRATHFMKRGDFRSPGDVVTPTTPRVLHPFDPKLPRDRLGLAQWLVDPANPMLGRTVVNRAFETFFGEGLVATGEDFGIQGDPPSHPELLDWLAASFTRGGMSVKSLHRQIVTSATYRQDSRVTPDRVEKDPRNRLFSRGARFRLEHEAIRDNALAIAGLLDDRIGGPSVMPPQPPGIWQDSFANFDTPQFQWHDAEGPDRYRRGIYTYLRRSAIYPAALSFDSSRRDVCVVERGRTVTPLQALTILNDPVFLEAAGGLAKRLLAIGESPEARIERAWKLCVARAPTAKESRRLLDLEARSRERFAARPEDAISLLRSARVMPPEGPSDRVSDPSFDAAGDVADSAAWVVVANTLLNLDETLTRD